MSATYEQEGLNLINQSSQVTTANQSSTASQTTYEQEGLKLTAHPSPKATDGHHSSRPDTEYTQGGLKLIGQEPQEEANHDHSLHGRTEYEQEGHALIGDTLQQTTNGAYHLQARPENHDSLQRSLPQPQDHEEYQYLNLIRRILSEGEHRPDRTGTGTLSIPFPPQHKYSLTSPSDSNTLILPLLTTKRVFLRAVIGELLWFISGDTNARTLQDQGVKIWDGNASRKHLEKVGLWHEDREEGDLGPVYGFQWRHFGAEYRGSSVDYVGQGVDQLADVVWKLKNTPYDRRIILSAWNPADLKKMALPPCHMFAQFYVSFPQRPSPLHTTREDGTARGVLHTLLYQRSNDIGLGVPFNIASYALLTHMLARCCDLTPGSLTHTMGDAHVYLDHREALEVQIERVPREFPRLEMEKEVGCGIDGWKAEDFKVLGYQPHGKLDMKMSV